MAEDVPAAAPLDLLARRALQQDRDQPAIEHGGRWYSWGELQGVAGAVAEALEASGAAPGAPVAFVGRNHPAGLAALVALIAAGRSVQMIYPFQSAAGVARDVATLRPALLVAEARDLPGPVREALASAGSAAVALDGMEAALAPGLERSQVPAPQAPAEPQIQILTSGTTGPPKRFTLPFDTVARHLIGFALNREGDAANPEAPTLLFMPLGNISGIYTTLPAILRPGARIHLMERFTLAGWLDYVKRYRPVASGVPPASVQGLLDADVPAEDLASLRYMGMGAAPLDPGVQRAFEARYGIAMLLSYGATEFGGPVTATTPQLHREFGARKLGAVGRPIPGAKLRTVDPATGEPLADGQEGLLEVVSPRIGPDWIRTSDIAVIDADGFLWLRGRADGAIVRGGFKLLPETIERALLTHPSVGAASVVGVADRRLGQTPGAAVVFKAGAAAVGAEVLAAHLREQVPSTHLPVHWRFLDELPKTPSMKVDRPAVQRLFADA